MLTRKNLPAALLLFSTLSGMATIQVGRVQAAIDIADAICKAENCTALTWGEGPVDAQGVPLQGITCSINNFDTILCVASDGLCKSTGIDAKGCAGTYVIMGQVGSCYQRTNKC